MTDTSADVDTASFVAFIVLFCLAILFGWIVRKMFQASRRKREEDLQSQSAR